jgi:VanZ family protein
LHFELPVLLPLLVSILIVFGSPYVGQARGELQSTFPEHYRWIVSGIVAVAAASAIVSALVQLHRSRRGSSSTEESAGLPIGVRYALIAAAMTIGAGYARAVRTGDPQVDIVEAFHFVEYGLVAYLFYRAWRRRPDVSGTVLAACAGVAVGVADEWVQWFVPARVGELHDIALNAVAVGCGLLVGMAVQPPVSLALPRHRASRVTMGAAVSVLVIAGAGFVDRVHLGHEIRDGQTAVFRSRYDAHALTQAAANRTARWEASPPPVRGFSDEDHYLSEGEWHVARRNVAVRTGDWPAAWGENAILERFYAPVLDRSDRWSMEQRAAVEQSTPASAKGPYVSDAEPYPIYVVRRRIFWLVTILISAAIVWLAARAGGASEPARN